MVSNIFTNTERRKWWKYEDINPAHKFKVIYKPNYADKFLERCVAITKSIIRSIAMSSFLPLAIMLSSVWASGFLAANKQSFWSLLVVVVGFIASFVIANIKEKN